ncbi:MAG TPA: sensor histidine kinase, partial [Opitutus sp.]|nr:sensor histidine kinase [Opitutus sp.]
MIIAALALATASPALGSADDATLSPLNVRGLPFTRSYPLEEVGEMPRGARLNFDQFGRLAVIYAGFYAVLNDTVWLDIAVKDEPLRVNMAQVVQAPDGRAYYCALGSWGTAEIGADGRLHAHSLVPPDAPKWALTTSFTEALATKKGVYFSGWNGVIYWDFASQKTRFFNLTAVSTIFAIADDVYASAHGQPLHRVDVEQGILGRIEGTSFRGSAVDHAAVLDATHALIAARNGELFVFDGRHATRWAMQERYNLTGRVLGLQHLVDGGVAVAISGKGLFFISPEGELLSALTTTHYQRITDIATREPGVLWVATE